MLTPEFELKQFPDYLLIIIRAPYIKANDVEIYIEDNEFKFYVKPYFLRLYFPHEVVEDGTEEAEYDISTGVFKIHIPKKNAGEFFPNLDLLTTLLATKKKHNLYKPIEVVGNTENEEKEQNLEILTGDGKEDYSIKDIDDDADFCWEVEQELFQPPDVLTGYTYGFANKRSGVFPRLQGELYEAVDTPDPDNTSPQERRELRIAQESAKFDPDYYIADFFDDDYIQELINYHAPWDREYERILTEYKSTLYPETSDLITPKGNPLIFSEEGQFVFTEGEKKTLLQLPNKDHLLNKNEENTVFLCLLDVIFAYAYNHRTTEGENTSESPWTICKISSSLSWLDSFKNVHDVLSSCVRRCLCYPLYRHWSLAQKILHDVQTIFLLGKRWLWRCLVELRSLLQSDENKYILNDLYITDLCIWIQKVKRKKIISLANKLQCTEITKSDMNFELTNIEGNACMEYVGEYVGSSSDSDKCSTASTEETSELADSSENSSLDSDDTENDMTSPTMIIPQRIEVNQTPRATDSPIIEIIPNSPTINSPTIVSPSTEVTLQREEIGISNEVETVRTGFEELLKIQLQFVGDETKDALL